jgi:hypothetical protein
MPRPSQQHFFGLSNSGTYQNLSTTGTKQLFNTVAVPRFTYSAEVWYTYLHKPETATKARGSVTITNKLCSVQCKVAKSITRGLSTTAGDIMDIHVYILLIDFLFCKLLFCATLHLCTLPTTHLLHPYVHSAVLDFVRGTLALEHETQVYK